MHKVQAVGAKVVTDTEGKDHNIRLVLPVNRESTVPGQTFTGGSAPRDERRQVVSRRFLQPLKEIVAREEDDVGSKAANANVANAGGIGDDYYGNRYGNN